MEHTDLNLGDIFSALPPLQEIISYSELLPNLLPRHLYYNITLFFTVLSCKDHISSQQWVDEEDKTDQYVSREDPNILQSIFSFLNFGTSHNDVLEHSTDEDTDSCEAFLKVDRASTVSLSTIACVLVAITLIWLALVYFVCFCLQFRKAVASENSFTPTDPIKDTNRANNISVNDLVGCGLTNDPKGNEERIRGKPLTAPLSIKGQTHRDQSAKTAAQTQRVDDLFELTLQHYLKELDVSIGVSSVSSIELAGAASLPASQDNVSCLTSPRFARKNLNQNNKIFRSPSLTDRVPRHNNETAVKSWISYDSFRKRLGWQFPGINLDVISLSQFSQCDKKLASILQFLHQNCPINPRQWDIATSVVNYSLFILEQELRNLCRVTQDYLQISRFEASGSAADGTLIGSADRFDVLLVFDIPSCAELILLHSNFSDEIPPGHVALGVKGGEQIIKEGLNYSRKACIQGIFASYLQAQKIVEKTETLMKKAILRLSREHKSKLDSLPFSFQMSQSKKLVLTFDTRLLHSFGLSFGEINVKITPAFDLSIAEYCLLPPLFAVPSIKSSASSSPATTGKGAMSRLFQAPGVSDLHWMIHTERLHSAIITDIEKHLSTDYGRIYHKECLMILKALFSPSHHNKLLNKGEVDSYILKTVVSFLLQESPPSAWSLENLANRVSDAVHFLRSTYENAWLPELSIHNPHLLGKMPSLKVMGHILQGRQRNLLANVTNSGALKVLDFVTHRLNETRLVHSLNEHFSSEMWEYEFFMFG